MCTCRCHRLVYDVITWSDCTCKVKETQLLLQSINRLIVRFRAKKKKRIKKETEGCEERGKVEERGKSEKKKEQRKGKVKERRGQNGGKGEERLHTNPRLWPQLASADPRLCTNLRIHSIPPLRPNPCLRQTLAFTSSKDTL